MHKVLSLIINVIILAFLVSCDDGSIIYESEDEINSDIKIKLHEVKIVEETKNKLTLDFVYTYKNKIPAEEIKLYIMPDHGYWSTNSVKIKNGKNSARAVIGISKSNMEKDNVSESITSKLRFRFDHYQPGKYLGNIWGLDVGYHKKWEMLKID